MVGKHTSAFCSFVHYLQYFYVTYNLHTILIQHLVMIFKGHVGLVNKKIGRNFYLKNENNVISYYNLISYYLHLRFKITYSTSPSPGLNRSWTCVFKANCSWWGAFPQVWMGHVPTLVAAAVQDCQVGAVLALLGWSHTR